ncbi:cysteine-rich CWC family protein [Zhongshania aliphaticivorans]|uniref:cysteine-rich CWC family protein n=1 Tax=Zhongshania aliphaticivorans TaxID=1470434 RepID=UPI001330A551
MPTFSAATATHAPDRCPLCEQKNQCAIAAGKPSSSCWCMTAIIDKTTLQKVARDSKKRCVCPQCGQVNKT